MVLRITLMCGNRLKLWNTMPTRRRIGLASTPTRVISRSSRWMEPSSIVSSRLMQRKSVVLPDPLAPMNETTSPGAIEMLS
ncbi:MAG: hypothetical protein RIS71_749 [Actinomycetota bacterium]